MYIKCSIPRKCYQMKNSQSDSHGMLHSHIFIMIRKLRFQICFILLACFCLLVLLSHEKHLLFSCICHWNLFHLSSSLCSTLKIEEQRTRDSVFVTPAQGNQQKKTLTTIDVSFVVGGAQAARQLVTLIKSILIHRNWQGQEESFKPSTKMTIPQSNSLLQSTKNKEEISLVNRGSGKSCYLTNINLHLLTDYLAYRSLSVLFKTWSIPNINVYYYHLEEYVNKVSWIPSTHYSGIFGLSKLLIPDILPDSVKKVISLDIDLLVNSDLLELWKYFDKFNSSQMIGLVANQSPWYLRKANRVVWPAWKSGYNTGVMLLHLDRLRKFHWSEHWNRTTKSALLRISHASLADQDIINTALIRYPSSIYELPCEWNVQLTSNMNTKLCQIIWFDEYFSNPTEGVTLYKFNRQLKIAHFNHPIKADMITMSEIADDDPLRKLLGLKLKRQFVRMYRYYQNLDGVLVRSPIKPTTCSTFPDYTSSFQKYNEMNSEKITIEGCEEFQEDMNVKHRIHPYFLHHNILNVTSLNKDNITNIENSISLVSQLTFDRIHRLEELAVNWLGPISLALYLTDREAALLVEFITNSRILQNRTNIGYHVVYVDGKFYPINTLRNIAIKYCTTEFIFHIDIDFLPQANMMQYIGNSIQQHLIQDNKSKNVCLVVPAFETFKNHLSLPETKETLIKSWELGEILPFRHEIWSAGHMSTNYSHWKSTDNDYEVQWSADYEPYVIVSRNATKFDENFIGFGWNKASYIMALDALGYKFIVLASSFLIHLPHPPSFEVFRYRMNSAYRSCIDNLKLDFIKRLAKKHGVQALKYLQFRKD